MRITERIVKYYLPGIVLIGLGFFSGAKKDAVIGLVGFLSFFTVGVLLILNGKQQK